MKRVLFHCPGDSCAALAACALARLRGFPDAEFLAAADREGVPPPGVAAAALDAGIPLPGRIPAIDALPAPLEVDLVIHLDADRKIPHPAFIGGPFHIDWTVDAASADASPEAARALIARIAAKVDALLADGYLGSILRQREFHKTVLDHIHDGLVVHDLSRRILRFNRAASEITGIPREEALGRDCHEVFGGAFCGSSCARAGGTIQPGTSRSERTVFRPDGEPRDLIITRRTLADDAGTPFGVLVTYHDVTRERALARRVRDRQSFAGIVTRDPRMLELFDLVRDLAASSLPVLLLGESGTGKELFAGALHHEGQRAGAPFVAVNCGAIPHALIESELFGHVRGAFTGATMDKKGRFELAGDGTIFLDEIGDLPLPLQVKLLRVLQEGTYERVGDGRVMRSGARIVSATNRDLASAVSAGGFREDLFYRLHVAPIRIPPLRERRDDIPILAEHILQATADSMGRPAPPLSDEALDRLLTHDWPGNVRELQNWIQYAFVRCRGAVIAPAHFPDPAATTPARAPQMPAPSPGYAVPPPAATIAPNVPLPPKPRRTLTAAEIRNALRAADGNRSFAAKLLGVSRMTLYRHLDRIGEEDPGTPADPK